MVLGQSGGTAWWFRDDMPPAGGGARGGCLTSPWLWLVFVGLLLAAYGLWFR